MGFEKSHEQQPVQKPQNLRECAEDAVNHIRSLKNGVDINALFPRMRELMETPDGHETFRRITDEVQVCQWKNGAVDRKAMSQLFAVIDPEASR